MKFKILVTVCLTLVLSSSLFGQTEKFNYNGHNISINDKLYNHYGSNYILWLKTNNPDNLLYLNYYIENGYSIIDIDGKANDNSIANISSLSYIEKSLAAPFNPNEIESFNILAFNILPTDNQQVYKIFNSTLAVIVLPKNKLIENFNIYRNSLLNQ